MSLFISCFVTEMVKKSAVSKNVIKTIKLPPAICAACNLGITQLTTSFLLFPLFNQL